MLALFPQLLPNDGRLEKKPLRTELIQFFFF